ncbi:MAG TPA: methyltransferase domain-containing protein [Candidatus Polarisedimenticolaceae bacterium]|nr:methyltransferase domain-containing protein [Candidatus Polarisedimenticolaceae bacterium]
MSLVSEYHRQRAWRAWPTVLDALPPLHGRTVLDLGCGVGDLAAELVQRGARVVGFDANEELLGRARAQGLRGAEFRYVDLRTADDLGVVADGLWASFLPAFFPDLKGALARWKRTLRPRAWAALIEIDDLFAHAPLLPRTQELLDAYAEDALRAGRYDFRMGRKLAGFLREAGFTVTQAFPVPDRELAFDGPAEDEVLDAWRLRFARMKLLQEFCGPAFTALEEDFLACLAREDHRCSARVQVCLGTLEGEEA